MTKATTVKKTAGKVKKEGPKRPTTAFFFYMSERRPQILKEKPDLKKQAKEVAKLVGAEWKGMTDAEKKPWNEKAKADKERYEAEKEKA